MPPEKMNGLGQAARRLAPMESVQAQPWAFMLLALAVGAGVGALVRFIGLRRALGIYMVARRFV